MNNAKPILGEYTIFGRVYYQDTDYVNLVAECERLTTQNRITRVQLEASLRANEQLRSERDAFRDSRNDLIEEVAIYLREIAELREVVSSLIDIAHEHRHELKQQRFSDNDEGDAFARHRDSRVGRIDRILQAALAASAGQEVES